MRARSVCCVVLAGLAVIVYVTEFAPNNGKQGYSLGIKNSRIELQDAVARNLQVNTNNNKNRSQLRFASTSGRPVSDGASPELYLRFEEPPQQFNMPEVISDKSKDSSLHKIDATIINPFRVAAVGAEIGGLIDKYKFEPGDLVKEGQTIVEISKKRYTLVARKAEERLKAIRLALNRAQKQKEIKEALLSMDASTVQEIEKAEAEYQMTKHKLLETEIELEQALLDLEACQVKAPFTGYLAIRQKEAYEVVAPLDKLFTIVDSAKVYAVANVPENLLQYFGKGAKAAFHHASGRQFLGEVDRIEPIIDPKTDTQKVYVLIDNSEENLGIGMSGSLESVK
jgi:RND family efflux transporter MFP subunit